jgi:hypothetical protein
MARKPQDPKILVDKALSAFKGAVADLKSATTILDSQARSKRATATRLNTEAADLEKQADEAALIAERLSGLITP